MASTVWIQNEELMRKLKIVKAIQNFSNLESLVEAMLTEYVTNKGICLGGKNETGVEDEKKA